MITKTKALEEVAKDIIDIEFTDDMKLGELYQPFYEVMRKNGIAAGTRSEGGSVSMYNYEWTMCLSVYQQKLKDNVEMLAYFVDIPDDLLAY